MKASYYVFWYKDGSSKVNKFDNKKDMTDWLLEIVTSAPRDTIWIDHIVQGKLLNTSVDCFYDKDNKPVD